MFDTYDQFLGEESMDREPEAPVNLGRATPLRETEKALLVMLESLEEIWVPKSVIHDDSECYSTRGGAGNLLVEAWWTRTNGRG